MGSDISILCRLISFDTFFRIHIGEKMADNSIQLLVEDTGKLTFDQLCARQNVHARISTGSDLRVQYLSGGSFDASAEFVNSFLMLFSIQRIELVRNYYHYFEYGLLTDT